MHYEEKVIEGVLYYREHPEGDWRQVSSVKMTADLLAARDRIERLEAELREECSV